MASVDLAAAVHAERHAVGGADAVSPAAIGAAASSHTHPQSQVTGLTSALNGKAASSHTHAQADVTGLSASLAGKVEGSRWLTGSGPPEGTVSAGVGTRYTDTAATNGAVEWIKAAGAGNTGWRVAYGDTGWRNLNGTVMTAEFSTANAGDKGIFIRRTGSLVTLTIGAATNKATDTTAGLAVPAGFESLADARPLGLLTVMRDPTKSIQVLVSGNQFLYLPNVIPVGTRVSGSFMWPTDSAWPTTLPGVAA